MNKSDDRRLSMLRTALDPIILFLDDRNVTDIMLNPDQTIWVDELGKGMRNTGVKLSPSSSERIIRLIAASVNAEINANNPGLSAILPGYGARVEAVIPPVSSAPSFAFRKPASLVYSLADYVRAQIISQSVADLLHAAVLQRKNLLIGGGTGSGKTTFANALLNVVANETNDRVYIAEDVTELQCPAPNLVSLLIDESSGYGYRQLLKKAMRYRPDRIIFGEVRDGAALELLKAWNTGHPGGIATLHADNAISMLDRMGELIEENNMPIPYRLITRAIDYCVHITRDPNHPSGRRLTSIIEVTGYDGKWEVENIA